MRSDPHRIVIHSGFHKTGTTSLQFSLRAHEPALAPAFRIEVLEGGSRAIRDAAQAARAYSAHPQAENLALLQFTLREWADGLDLAPGQGLLLSCEDFAGHMPGHRRVRGYDQAAPIAAAMADALATRFGPALDLNLLYTTRAAAQWLRSIHWQLAKHDAMTLSPEVYARRFADAADHDAIVAAVRAAQPFPVHQAMLEDLASRRLGPVEAIYDLANLPDATRAALSPLPPANESPPHDLAEVFIALNRVEMPKDLRREMKRALSSLSRGLPPLL